VVENGKLKPADDYFAKKETAARRAGTSNISTELYYDSRLTFDQADIIVVFKRKP
jgi:hypothetical protein